MDKATNDYLARENAKRLLNEKASKKKIKLDYYKEIKLSEGTASPYNNSVSVDIGNGYDTISFTKEDLDIMYKIINGEYEVSEKKEKIKSTSCSDSEVNNPERYMINKEEQ